VSFPGGKRSDSDADLVQTALRESSEEIGIDSNSVTILGALDDVYTMATDFIITPIVGLLDGPPVIKPNPAEVDEVFTVELNYLQDPGNHEVETKTFGGSELDVPLIATAHHKIWGATHTITMNFLKCLEVANAQKAG